MPTVAVVIAAGVVARLVTAKVNGPPMPPVVIFCTATVAGFAALVKMQLTWDPGTTLVAGIVSTLPLNVPKLPGLPVFAALLSLQVAVVGVKLPLAVSVIRTAVFEVVTVMAVGAAGVAVATAAVVMAGGTADRLVAVKLNVPAAKPVVIFWMATVGIIAALVKVQVIWAAGKTLAAGMVSKRPLSVPKLAGFPVTPELASVQVAVVKVNDGLAPSEI